MLTPAEICILVKLNDKYLDLSAHQRGYGLASGQSYNSGHTKLDSSDRGKEVLICWENFPITAKTMFLGKIPTPENVFDLQAHVSFEVKDLIALYQHHLKDSEKLPVETFAGDVAAHIRWIVSRLACEFSSRDLVFGGPAQHEGEGKLLKELNRIYEPEGIVAQAVSLRRIEVDVRECELQLLAKKIKMEAQEKELALEEAFEQERQELSDRAKAGNEAARTLVTRIGGVNSFNELDARLPKDKEQSPVEVDSEKPSAVVTTDPILVAETDRAVAKFAVLSRKQDPRYYQILRPWFFLGRDANCHVALPSEGVSSLHATVASIGSGLAVIDHHSVNGTYYSGEQICQLLLQTGDVLQIDDFWVVFKVNPSQEFQQIDRSYKGAIASSGQTVPRAGRIEESLESAGPIGDVSAIVRLASSSGRMASSDSRPILIGHDSACELGLSGGGVGRFHAVVSWDADLDSKGNIRDAGVFVEDLHSGRGTLLNGNPTQRARVRDGDTLEVGGHRITVSVTGNVRNRAEALFNVRPEAYRLALTCIEGPGSGASIRLRSRIDRLLLGHDEDCHLTLPSEEVSGKHAEITRDKVRSEGTERRVQFMISDLDSTNGTYLNGRRLESGQPHPIGPGDIFRLSGGKGHCDFLVHYDL